MLPSLKLFLLGSAPWAVGFPSLFLLWRPDLDNGLVVVSLKGFMLGLVALGMVAAPCGYVEGARSAWHEIEQYRRGARISRWLNVLGLAAYLGVMFYLAILFLGRPGGI